MQRDTTTKGGERRCMCLPRPPLGVGVEVGAVTEETNRASRRWRGEEERGGNRDAAAWHTWRPPGAVGSASPPTPASPRPPYFSPLARTQYLSRRRGAGEKRAHLSLRYNNPLRVRFLCALSQSMAVGRATLSRMSVSVCFQLWPLGRRLRRVLI